eukprot:gene10030-20890_t
MNKVKLFYLTVIVIILFINWPEKSCGQHLPAGRGVNDIPWNPHLKDTKDSLYRLLRCGFKPTHILDVGANTGDWTKLMRSIFHKSYFFMIEANDQCEEHLRNRGFHGWSSYEISLVGNYTGYLTYYKRSNSICINSTGNSIYVENTPFYSSKIEIRSKITTIDEIIRLKKLSRFQFVKLDIQGSEIMALQGAIQTLQNVEVILTEAPVMNFNNDAPTFLKLYEYLDKLGYGLYDIPTLTRDVPRGVLIQCDILWVKKSSPLWKLRNFVDLRWNSPILLLLVLVFYTSVPWRRYRLKIWYAIIKAY